MYVSSVPVEEKKMNNFLKVRDHKVMPRQCYTYAALFFTFVCTMYRYVYQKAVAESFGFIFYYLREMEHSHEVTLRKQILSRTTYVVDVFPVTWSENRGWQ